MFSAAIHQRILKYPAHARGIRTNFRAHAGRQLALNLVQILQHARTGPVQIGAVFKNDVHVRIAKLRKTAHGLCAGNRQHGGSQWIGDLIFNNLRGLAGIAGFDNHLNVREVGQGIDWRVNNRPCAPDAEEQRPHHDQETVGDRPPDNPFNHHRLLNGQNARRQRLQRDACAPARR